MTAYVTAWQHGTSRRSRQEKFCRLPLQPHSKTSVLSVPYWIFENNFRGLQVQKWNRLQYCIESQTHTEFYLIILVSKKELSFILFFPWNQKSFKLPRKKHHSRGQQVSTPPLGATSEATEEMSPETLSLPTPTQFDQRDSDTKLLRRS